MAEVTPGDPAPRHPRPPRRGRRRRRHRHRRPAAARQPRLRRRVRPHDRRARRAPVRLRAPGVLGDRQSACVRCSRSPPDPDDPIRDPALTSMTGWRSSTAGRTCRRRSHAGRAEDGRRLGRRRRGVLANTLNPGDDRADRLLTPTSGTGCCRPSSASSLAGVLGPGRRRHPGRALDPRLQRRRARRSAAVASSRVFDDPDAGRPTGRPIARGMPYEHALTPLLQMRGIVKRFPGVLALGGVDLDVRAGRGALPARPERRRQVDADQGALRRATSPTRARSSGRASPSRWRTPAGRDEAGHLHDLPGARPGRRASPSRRTSSSATSCRRPASASAAATNREAARAARPARAQRDLSDPRRWAACSPAAQQIVSMARALSQTPGC